MNTPTEITAAGLTVSSVPLTPDGSGNITTDVSTANNFTVIITTNVTHTLVNPTGAVAGDDMKVIVWRFKQHASTPVTISLGTKFRFGTDITSFALSTTVSKQDYFACRYHATDDKYDIVAVVKGF